MDEITLGIVRHFLTIAAGYLVHKNVIAGDIVDTIVSALIGIGGIVWSVVQKIQAGAKAMETTLPAQSAVQPGAVQPSASQPSQGIAATGAGQPAGWFPKATPVVIGALALLFAAGSPAQADGPPTSRSWQPKVAAEEPFQFPAGVWYLSVIGSYANNIEVLRTQREEDDLFSAGRWRAGLGIGWLARSDKLGYGFDIDAMRSFNSAFSSEWDNWNVGGRARLGWFFTDSFMAFGSLGYAHAWATDTVVYGLGAEKFLGAKSSIRAEWLHYDSVTTSPDEFRLSLNFKL
jgi:hypothetical protein